MPQLRPPRLHSSSRSLYWGAPFQPLRRASCSPNHRRPISSSSSSSSARCNNNGRSRGRSSSSSNRGRTNSRCRPHSRALRGCSRLPPAVTRMLAQLLPLRLDRHPPKCHPQGLRLHPPPCLLSIAAVLGAAVGLLREGRGLLVRILAQAAPLSSSSLPSDTQSSNSDSSSSHL